MMGDGEQTENAKLECMMALYDDGQCSDMRGYAVNL